VILAQAIQKKMTMVTERMLPVLAFTLIFTSPLPLPEDGLTLIQSAPGVAVQLVLEVMVAVEEAAAASKLMAVGCTERVSLTSLLPPPQADKVITAAVSRTENMLLMVFMAGKIMKKGDWSPVKGSSPKGFTAWLQ
jgi:hypothetical protein